jgi:hypothetical protein
MILFWEYLKEWDWEIEMKQLLSFRIQIHPFLFRLGCKKSLVCDGLYGSALIYDYYFGPFVIGAIIPKGKYGEGLK